MLSMTARTGRFRLKPENDGRLPFGLPEVNSASAPSSVAQCASLAFLEGTNHLVTEELQFLQCTVRHAATRSTIAPSFEPASGCSQEGSVRRDHEAHGFSS
jgi:hypothetical protein